LNIYFCGELVKSIIFLFLAEEGEKERTKMSSGCAKKPGLDNSFGFISIRLQSEGSNLAYYFAMGDGLFSSTRKWLLSFY